MIFITILFATAAVASTDVDVNRTEAQATAGEAAGSATGPVKLSLDYKSDVVRGLRGGTDSRATFLGALNVGVDVDLGRVLDAKGLTASAQGLALHGAAPGERIGDLQGTDNISATRSVRLYQAWLQQNLFQERLSLLAGLHDLSTEFNVTESAGVFMNSSFGITPELARSGKAGPSYWPNTALGARARGQPTEALSLSMAVYNGVPGDPAHPESTTLALRERDGVMAITELSYSPDFGGLPGKLAAGAWGYDRKNAELFAVNEEGLPLESHSVGLYMMFDQKLYAPTARSPLGLSGFLRLGWADATTDSIEYGIQSGLSYTGLIPRREQDQLGLGIAVARAGEHFRAANAARGIDTALLESTLELTYRLRVASWLYVQPDVQWVTNPGLNEAAADAIVGAGRIGLTF
ncbi:MAG: carbohydrate porin [Deltaproteobacteria bacterium]|nr:carbohydrate porin [Deltaproteobacteria bacterium]